MDLSKRLIEQNRWFFPVISIGALLLAGVCIFSANVALISWITGMAGLPWLSAMVGLPWTAHGVVCSFYLNMAKSDHKEGGITFECAKAVNFDNDGGTYDE